MFSLLTGPIPYFEALGEGAARLDKTVLYELACTVVLHNVSSPSLIASLVIELGACNKKALGSWSSVAGALLEDLSVIVSWPPLLLTMRPRSEPSVSYDMCSTGYSKTVIAAA